VGGLKVGQGIEQWSYTLKLSWKTQTSSSDFYFSGITVWVNDTVIEPSISRKCIQYLYPCLYSLSIAPSLSTEISPSAHDSGLKLDLFNHQQHHLLQCHSNGTTMRQWMPTSTIPQTVTSGADILDHFTRNLRLLIPGTVPHNNMHQQYADNNHNKGD